MKHLKNIISCFTVFCLISCSSDYKTDNNIGHTCDSISLSLYGINLGDSINRIYDLFSNVYEVNLNKISYYLPLKEELGNVYKEMGISLLAVDTTFIVDHRLKKSSYTRNDSHIDFTYDLTEHPAILTFFVLNDHVLQLELFVSNPYFADRTYGDYFPYYRCGETVLQMFIKQYGECDSLLFASNKTNKSITLSINAKNGEIAEAQKELEYDYELGYIWQWKNAQIIAHQNFKHGLIDRLINFWGIFRVIYTDFESLNKEINRRELERLNEQDRVEQQKNEYQNQLQETFKKQDF